MKIKNKENLLHHPFLKSQPAHNRCQSQLVSILQSKAQMDDTQNIQQLHRMVNQHIQPHQKGMNGQFYANRNNNNSNLNLQIESTQPQNYQRLRPQKRDRRKSNRTTILDVYDVIGSQDNNMNHAMNSMAQDRMAHSIQDLHYNQGHNLS